MSSLSILHAVLGGAGLVSGAAAILAPKGRWLHRRAGAVFFFVMLGTAGSGAGLAVLKGEVNNAVAGTITAYLLLTGLMAVRQREGRAGFFELGAFLFSAGGAATAFYFAVEAVRSGGAMLGGVPYVVFASIMSLAALLDLSLVLRQGVAGRQRVARHLWRMSLGFAAAVGSFFPGQIEIFPAAVQNIRPMILLFVPVFSVLGLMLFWLARVLFTNAFGPASPTRSPAS